MISFYLSLRLRIQGFAMDMLDIMFLTEIVLERRSNIAWFIRTIKGWGQSFLARSSERRFNERPYLHHSVYLFLVETNKQRMAQQSNLHSCPLQRAGMEQR